ncbi:MAG: inorganic phosphate transporter [candidate division KSB1 bacterium]|nr:inorganic phosphate transporter [candidate division KSB1 bacterium]
MGLSDMVLLATAVAAGLYMAWNIGANDVANSMASAVGAKAITLKQAVAIAAVLEFTGAFFVGNHVTKTIAVGLVRSDVLPDQRTLMLGALAAVLAAGLWVFLATWKEMPVSTTHSIVGAMVGFGFVLGGVRAVIWSTVAKVVLSWIVSPLMGGLLSYALFKLIVRSIFSAADPIRRGERLIPLFVVAAAWVIVTSLLAKTPFGKKVSGWSGIEITLGRAMVIGLVAGIVAGLFAAVYIYTRVKTGRRSYADVEMLFRRLQVLTSCYVAFAHGANDVANAVGPVATFYTIFREGSVGKFVEVPPLLLALGGLGISLGVATWGYKVINTLGSKITVLTNTRGFSVDMAVATTVLVASKFGMPISTTHTAVGAVIGVGLARGIDALNLEVLWNIAVSWLLTVPAAALSSGLIFGLLTLVF